MLSQRQELLLRKVVDQFAQTAAPVGSNNIAAEPDIPWGPSTVRSELSALEQVGLLAHPHTSAGRVPTEQGYRYYVDHLIDESRYPESDVGMSAIKYALAQQELDSAMRSTAEMLSHLTNLLAVITAPSINTATIHHIEVMRLQPRVLMLVIITSTGAISKRVLEFDADIDPGLADWTRSYLNEKLAGTGLGARTLRRRLEIDLLNPIERDFVSELLPVLSEIDESDKESFVYVEGATRLMAEYEMDSGQLSSLMGMLERRMSLLSFLSQALTERGEVVRIGRENSIDALQSLSVVTANYGLPQRSLGTVSLIGPTRMNYGLAIKTVRDTALALTLFIEGIYE